MILRFGDGKEFKVYEVLSERNPGTMTIIIDIGGGKALRIPRLISDFILAEFNGFLQAYQVLEATGIHCVKVYPELSLPGQYYIVDKLDIRFSLTSFLNGTSGLTQEEYQIALERFLKFAESTYLFRSIGDFMERNIAYTQTGEWIFLDFQNHFVKWTKGEQKFNTFQWMRWNGSFRSISDDLFMKINRSIALKRFGPSGLDLWITHQIPEVHPLLQAGIIDFDNLPTIRNPEVPPSTIGDKHNK